MEITQSPISPLLFLVILIGYLVWFSMQIRLSYRIVRLGRRIDRFSNVRKRVQGVFELMFLQKKILNPRFMLAGITHAAIFFGFLVVAVNTINFIGAGLWPGFSIPFHNEHWVLGRAYLFSKDVFELVVLAAVMVAIWRRTITRPKRLTLSGEATLVLVLIGVLMVVDWTMHAAQMSAEGVTYKTWLPVTSLVAGWLPQTTSTLKMIYLISFWAHLITLLSFLNLLPRSKHFHVVTALFTVFSRNLDVSKLETLDMEDEEAEHFGASRIEHFHWKTLLDLYSCTECGRCEDVCPANQTDKPLSPKMLTIHMRDHMKEYAEYALEGRSEEYPGDPLVRGWIEEDVLWSCLTCRACEEACPLDIEYVDRIVDMRRFLVLEDEEGELDSNADALFRNLENNGNPWGIGQAKREEWTEGLDVPRMRDKQKTDVLLWVGCAGAFDAGSIPTARAMVNLLNRAGVDYAILGSEETCTGDSARRLGNEYLYQMLAAQNIETLSEYEFQEIVTLCPHCLNTLAHEYPDLGGTWKVTHYAEYLQRLLENGSIRPGRVEPLTITYHDSCYLGRHNQIYDAPRGVLEAIPGVNLVEMAHHHADGLCCGAGGGRMWLEEDAPRVNELRVSEILDTDAGQVCTSCPFCGTMMDDGLKALNTDGHRDVSRLDLAVLLDKAVN